MRKIASYILAFVLICNAAGCVPLIVGATVGGVAVYAVSKDTVQGETDKTYDSIWNAALRVGKIRGTIKQENYTKGTIELEAESSRVYIRVFNLTRATTRLRVSARKYHMPNIGLAQDMFVKIMEEAR